MTNHIPCVILCGGKSTRMKEDKALLAFEGFDTLTQFQLSKFENVYVSCKDRSKFGFEANFIEDISNTFAPSTAILSVFKRLQSEHIFFLSVDTPYFGKDELEKLHSYMNRGYEAIVPTCKEKVQPLCAIYNKKSMQKLQELHEKKDYKLQNFLKQINTKFVEYEDERVFTNLNYYHEYIKGISKTLDTHNGVLKGETL